MSITNCIYENTLRFSFTLPHGVIRKWKQTRQDRLMLCISGASNFLGANFQERIGC